MDIHSQHETLQLGNQSFQLRLVDAYAENSTLTEQYATAWSDFQKAKRAYETLTAEADTLRQEADYVRFQLDELLQASLAEGEQETLEAELRIAEHAEEIKTRFQQTLDVLSRSEFASRQSLGEARNHLQAITGYATAIREPVQKTG